MTTSGFQRRGLSRRPSTDPQDRDKEYLFSRQFYHGMVDVDPDTSLLQRGDFWMLPDGRVRAWTGDVIIDVAGPGGPSVGILTVRIETAELSSTHAVVNIRVADSRPGGNITVTPTATGVGEVTPSGAQVIPGESATGSLETSAYVSFLIERLPTSGRVVFTATAADRFPVSGSIDFPSQGEPGEDGLDGTSARIRMWNTGGSVTTDALIEVQNDDGESGLLSVWVGPSSTSSPDPEDPPDGSTVFVGSPFVANKDTVFGADGTLLASIPVSANQPKEIFARAVFSSGREVWGQHTLGGIIQVIDPFGLFINGSVNTAALALNAVTNPNVDDRAISIRNLVIGSFDNLIADPIFEAAGAFGAAGLSGAARLQQAGWAVVVNSGGSWGTTTTNPFAGSHAAIYNRGGQSGSARIQTGPVNGPGAKTAKAGDQHYLQARARLSGAGSGGQARVKIAYRNGAGTAIAVHPGPIVNLTFSYQVLSVATPKDQPAPAGTASVQFELEVLDVGTIANILWDDCFAWLKANGLLIVDGSIVADHMTANSVTTFALAANSGTFEKLAIGSFANLIPDPIFSSGKLWPDGNWRVAQSSGGVWSITTANTKVGEFCLSYNRSGQTTTSRIRHTALGMEAHGDDGVTPGEEFYFRAHVRGTGLGGGTSAGVGIVFRNAAGGIIDSITSVTPAVVGAYSLRQVSATAPAGTVRVDFELVVLNNGSTQTIRFDDCYAQRKTDGNLYVDGSITAIKLAVEKLDAISADVGVLTAGRLQNASNTAGVLLGGSLPGTWTRYLNLTAAGTEPFLLGPFGNIILRANGVAEFKGTVFIDGESSEAAQGLVSSGAGVSINGRGDGVLIADSVIPPGPWVHPGPGIFIGGYDGAHPLIPQVNLKGDQIRLNCNSLAFFQGSPTAQVTIGGSRDNNVALQALLNALDLMGLVDDQTTAG